MLIMTNVLRSMKVFGDEVVRVLLHELTEMLTASYRRKSPKKRNA